MSTIITSLRSMIRSVNWKNAITDAGIELAIVFVLFTWLLGAGLIAVLAA